MFERIRTPQRECSDGAASAAMANTESETPSNTVLTASGKDLNLRQVPEIDKKKVNGRSIVAGLTEVGTHR
jgi:hypothetical protein